MAAARSAERVAKQFQLALRRLSENPSLGHRREDLTTSGVLFYPVWSWLVIYTPDTKPLEIVRVLHAARDVEAIFADQP